MNGTTPKIEIIKPFTDAIELTKVILFKPFNLSKWCVIGFAAFLSNLGGGGGFNFNNFGNWRGAGSSHSSSASPSFNWHDSMTWLLPVIIVVALLGIGVVLALMWVGCRGKFIFTDCIVRNRAAIAEPWREYGREGNSLFVFTLIAIAIVMAAAIVIAVPVGVLWMSTASDGFSWPGLIAIIIFAPLFLLLVIAFGFVREFMGPVMYRQRATAMSAFRQVISLVRGHPGEMVLYFLFLIAVAVGTGMAVIFLMCATCCIVLIPYVGTVIMLPIFVGLRSYLLLFLRQFGPDYDAWGGLAPSAPPVQGSPTPPAAPAV
jgi:hypothetical protein